MANVSYASGVSFLLSGGDWSSKEQTFKVLLANKLYRPSSIESSIESAVTFELTASGYSRRELKGRAIESSATGAIQCMADTVRFTKLDTENAYRWAVVFYDAGSDAASIPLVAIDVGEVSLKNIREHAIRWSGAKDRGAVFQLSLS